MANSLYNCLQKPVITEKSMKGQEDSKYTFVVPAGVNKVEVKQAVEKIYGVKVDSVNAVKIGAKKRMVGRGRFVTKRQAQVKMIVTLKKGASLDVFKIKDK